MRILSIRVSKVRGDLLQIRNDLRIIDWSKEGSFMNYTPFGTRCNVQKLYFQWPISELNFGLDMRVTIACGGDRYFFLA